MSKILEAWLKERDWTQSRLAEELGISRSAISQIMREKSRPSLETASKLIKLSERYDPPHKRLTIEMLIQRDYPNIEDESKHGRLSVVIENKTIERLRSAALCMPGMSLEGLVTQVLNEYARHLEASAADPPSP